MAETEQAMLRESEARFRILFERSPDCVLLFDMADATFFDCNKAALEILRCEKSWLIGKHPWELAPRRQPDGEPSEEKATEIIRKLAPSKGGAMTFEWEHGRGDGSHFPAHISITTVDLDGREVWFCVVRDITEAKQAEQQSRELRASLEERVTARTRELARANRELSEAKQTLTKSLAAEKELSELKSNFVSMISHEFRTPLGVILSSAELLQNHIRHLSEDLREQQLARIRESTLNLARLVDEVLLLGQSEAGQLRFTPAPVDLEDFCSRLVDEVHSATSQICPIELATVGLPRAARSDEAILRHIFGNLLTNAVKYSAPGQKVRFSVEQHRKDAVFTVTDSGIGIPEAEQDRVFQAFSRAGNVGRITGSGLGLAIVQRCVTIHGGTISLDSRPHVGTTVMVRLPVFAASPTNSRRSRSRKTDGQDSPH